MTLLRLVPVVWDWRAPLLGGAQGLRRRPRRLYVRLLGGVRCHAPIYDPMAVTPDGERSSGIPCEQPDDVSRRCTPVR